MTLGIAALHALIPSHWLAFALVGRAKRWTVGKTLQIAALAGAGHVLSTIGLGLLLSVAGKALLDSIPEQLEHAAASLLLIALGIGFLVQARRGAHICSHPHDHESEAMLERRIGSNLSAVGALVMGLTLSPCLELLPVYVAASGLSWLTLLIISATMAVTTLGIMLLLVWLTSKGLEKLNFRWLERHEGTLVGMTLIALGIAMYFMEF
jgi:cadmium resistance protein CadD (predicted permease)